MRAPAFQQLDQDAVGAEKAGPLRRKRVVATPKTVYLANPYGFSTKQRALPGLPIVAALEELGLEVWVPFARSNQIYLEERGWAYRVGQRSFSDVDESGAILAVVNGVPPDEGVSIGHIFQDKVVIPSHRRKI